VTRPKHAPAGTIRPQTCMDRTRFPGKQKSSTGYVVPSPWRCIAADHKSSFHVSGHSELGLNPLRAQFAIALSPPHIHQNRKEAGPWQ
jgi:hypothetical protein